MEETDHEVVPLSPPGETGKHVSCLGQRAGKTKKVEVDYDHRTIRHDSPIIRSTHSTLREPHRNEIASTFCRATRAASR